MLVIGAKGFATEVLEVLKQMNALENLVFYDDVNLGGTNFLYKEFEILTKIDQARTYFEKTDCQFTLGIGNPFLRKMLYDKFTSIGGMVCSTISSQALIGSYDVSIGNGTNVLSGAIFSNSTTIGLCGIVYYNSIITHDCEIGDFVEISPAVTILGGAVIGSYTHIGANSTILPRVKIGDNVVIGAGSVVTKDIPDNCLAMGSPARIIKRLDPILY